MSTQYVLVDLENVQPDLSQLIGTTYEVRVFVGAKQQEQRHKYDFTRNMLALKGRAELIEITRSGSNAVDMHIAWYIGGLLEREPDARIHIISGDTDFDPLIEFLTLRKVDCRRTKTLGDLVNTRPKATRAAAAPRAPAPPRAAAAPRAARQPRAKSKPVAAPAPARTATEIPDKLLKQLRSMSGKPSSRAKLSQVVAKYFEHHGGERGVKVVDQTIDELLRRGLVTQDGKKLDYNLGA